MKSELLTNQILRGSSMPKHAVAIEQAVNDGLVSANMAETELSTWKAFDMTSLMFRGLNYERGNPLAILDTNITPGLLSEMRDWLGSVDKDETKYLQLNSMGGSAVTGVAAMNLLRADGNVVVSVHGKAFSSASLILQGGNKRIMLPGSQVGIHRSWNMVIGNSAALRERADQMDTMDSGMTEIYMTRIGDKADEVEIIRLMEKETVLTRERSIELGLADEMMDTCPSAGMRIPNDAKDDDERPDYEFGAKTTTDDNSCHLADLMC